MASRGKGESSPPGPPFPLELPCALFAECPSAQPWGSFLSRQAGPEGTVGSSQLGAPADRSLSVPTTARSSAGPLGTAWPFLPAARPNHFSCVPRSPCAHKGLCPGPFLWLDTSGCNRSAHGPLRPAKQACAPPRARPTAPAFPGHSGRGSS